MSDELKPVEETPPLGLLGLADHFEQLEAEVALEKPPDDDKEVDAEDSP